MPAYPVTLTDQQTVLVHTGPETATGRFPTVPPINFVCSNPNAAELEITANPPNQPDPFAILIKPKVPFFGPNKTYTITFGAAPKSGFPPVQHQIALTVQGTEPDNGELDHFNPTNDPPQPAV